MMRLVLENRGVVSGIVAAGVWAASRSLAPLPDDNPALVLIVSAKPHTPSPLIRRSASITYTSLNHKGEEAPKALATRDNLPAPNHFANTSPGKHQMVWNFNGFSREGTHQRTAHPEVLTGRGDDHVWRVYRNHIITVFVDMTLGQLANSQRNAMKRRGEYIDKEERVINVDSRPIRRRA